MKILKFAILFALFSMTVFAQSNQEKVRQTAEMFVTAYNGKDSARIEREFNAEMSAAITSDKLKEFLDGTQLQLGKIVKLGTPNFVAPTVAAFPVEFERGKLELLIALDAQGKIAELRIAPPQLPKPKNTSRNQTKLALPFRGEWFVVWGGDTREQNQHQDALNQRFAFDILKVGADGKSHKGDGKRNEDYYAFGQEIIAPADGVATYVVDGVQDNVPGEMNRMFVPGNLLIVKHAEGEYSLFAHFKQNSIRIKVGDKVTKGRIIGLCGNSGNSNEAHLHYQFQNTPFFADEASMKVFFEKLNVRREGKAESKTDYSPVKGNFVSN
ncbi:MAG TPA: peptidoglycan DD-metalloendopeptidase family protein [Pyrinomonadaceae bacterium]|nr:peptidoglycan DD-metalloendopeptidase family protein [Pyrinomonadaceae bacterium]